MKNVYKQTMQQIVKVISLKQPWASLIALGAKPIETRDRSINYRGRIYIHSSLKFDKADKALCLQHPFSKYVPDPDALPLGQIIAYCDVVSCLTTDMWMQEDAKRLRQKYGVAGGSEAVFFGNFDPGRYGYELEDIVKLENPIPAKGSVVLGWDFDITPYL